MKNEQEPTKRNCPKCHKPMEEFVHQTKYSFPTGDGVPHEMTIHVPPSRLALHVCEPCDHREVELLEPMTVITTLTELEESHLENRNLRLRIASLEGIIRKLQKADEWLPGQWLCQKCGFSLCKSIMYTSDGSIGANKSPLNEICPNDGTLMVPMTFEVGFRDAQKAFDSWIPVIANARELKEAAEKHDKVTTMVSRFCVAWKGHLPESWRDGFVECGAITIDPNYPTTFIAPVLLLSEPPKP